MTNLSFSLNGKRRKKTKIRKGRRIQKEKRRETKKRLTGLEGSAVTQPHMTGGRVSPFPL